MKVNDNELQLSEEFIKGIHNLVLYCASKDTTRIKIALPIDVENDDGSVEDSGQTLMVTLTFDLVDNEELKNDD